MATSSMAKARKLALGAVVAGVVLAAASHIAHRAGEETAAKDKERLALLWPSIMDMPLDDRAFLVGLAMTCGLHRQPVEKAAIVLCLRSAATDPGATLPVGFDWARASAKLESMLPAGDVVGVYDAVRLPDGQRFAISNGQAAQGMPVTIPAGSRVYLHHE